jgi:cytochrome oxidase assembly protein ShyY1
MIARFKNRTAVQRTALVSLFVVVLALVGLGVFRLAGEQTMTTALETTRTNTTIPPIDANQPSQVETATFALG